MTTKPVTVFSAFDGVAIGLLALKRAGIPVAQYYASEVDKYAIQVAKKNHPEIIHVGDSKRCWARDFPKIDLLIGGSPCQDLSIAKAGRKGLSGERSGLFWHYVRLLRTCKPKYFLFENVASMSKSDREQITEALGVDPILINSALVSAQQRNRLYWTNIPGITQPLDMGILLTDILENGITDRKKSRCVSSSIGRTTYREYLIKQQNTMAFQPIRLNPTNEDGKQPPQQDRIYSVFGKMIALTASLNGRQNTRIDLPDGEYRIRKLTPLECERLQTWPDNYTEGISNTQRYKCIGNGWTEAVIEHIFRFIPREEL